MLLSVRFAWGSTRGDANERRAEGTALLLAAVRFQEEEIPRTRVR